MRTLQRIRERYGIRNDNYYTLYTLNGIEYSYDPSTNKYYRKTGDGLTAFEGFSLEELKNKGVVEVQVYLSKRRGNVIIPDRSRFIEGITLNIPDKQPTIRKTGNITTLTEDTVTPFILKDLLRAYGFEEDRWGNMKKTLKDGRLIRYKFQKISVRREAKSHGSPRWTKIGGNYYSKIQIKNGRIIGI